MTAESLKPFINNLPMDSMKKKSNIPFICFGIFVIIICVLLSFAQIWNITRTTKLENEIVDLKITIEEMKKTLGYDIVKDFKEFKNEYNHRIKVKGDDFDKDLEVDIDIDPGSGEYGDDDDDLDEYGLNDDILLNDIKTRKVRSIVATNQGVPIIEEPYGARKNRTDYWANHIRNKNQQNEPKLKYDWTPKGKKQGWHLNNYEAHRASQVSYITPAEHASSSASASYNHHKKLKEYTSEAEATTRKDPELIQNRSSRVMTTHEDKSKAFRQVISKKDYAKMMNSDNRFLEQIRRPEQVVYPKKSLKSRGAATRHRTIGIHYVGDTSRYTVNRHENYFGNNIIRNRGIYSDWATPIWPNSYAMERFFVIDEGVVTVKENGLYYVYAQIFYHDDHDTNGFVIEHENIPFLQCTTMTHSTQRLTKSNSCYTGGVTHIRAGDTIKIVDLANHRYSLFEASKSFFGLVKFGDLRLPQHHGNGHVNSNNGHETH